MGVLYEIDRLTRFDCKVFRDAYRKAYLGHMILFNEGLIVNNIYVWVNDESYSFDLSSPNFPFMFSMFDGRKINLPDSWRSGIFPVPVMIQTEFYDRGYYWASSSANSGFINQFSTLASFPMIRGITDNAQGSFLMMDNDTTHEPCELQLPDYIPSDRVDNEGLETGYRSLSNGRRFEDRSGISLSCQCSSFASTGKVF